MEDIRITQIKGEICDLRNKCEELQHQANVIWQSADDERTDNVADYMQTQLEYIASLLCELEEIQGEDSDAPQEEIDEMNDWWSELDNLTKSEICNIPFPTFDDGGRGDNEDEFKERTDKWWKAQTIQRKREIREGNADTDGLEVGLQEWWDDLSNEDKSSIVGIPAPSRNDARGDEQYAFDDYCNKWWNAKTIAQKQETYKEWADELPWWETD